MGWREFHASRGSFSLRYPPTWSLTDCTPGPYAFPFVILSPVLSIGRATPASSAGCPAEGLAEIELVTGAPNGDPFNGNFHEESSAPVVVAGVTGRRRTGTGSGGMGMAPRNDMTAVEYLFTTNARTYFALYVRDPGRPDMAGQFDELIRRGLTFSS